MRIDDENIRKRPKIFCARKQNTNIYLGHRLSRRVERAVEGSHIFSRW